MNSFTPSAPLTLSQIEPDLGSKMSSKAKKGQQIRSELRKSTSLPTYSPFPAKADS